MTFAPSEIEIARRRVDILKKLVRAERKRAQDNPISERNVSLLGIIEPGTSHRDAKEILTQTFNELELMLDRLSLAHMAASFEFEASRRIERAITESAAAIENQRSGDNPWPINLLRQVTDFHGLKSMEDLVVMNERQRQVFKSLRKARNDFVHTGKVDKAPEITDVEALEILRFALHMLK